MKYIRTILCVALLMVLALISNSQAYVEPYPGNCQLYRECDASGCFVKMCGAGTEFNPNIMTCDYPLSDRQGCSNRG